MNRMEEAAEQLWDMKATGRFTFKRKSTDAGDFFVHLDLCVDGFVPYIRITLEYPKREECTGSQWTRLIEIEERIIALFLDECADWQPKSEKVYDTLAGISSQVARVTRTSKPVIAACLNEIQHSFLQ